MSINKLISLKVLKKITFSLPIILLLSNCNSNLNLDSISKNNLNSYTKNSNILSNYDFQLLDKEYSFSTKALTVSYLKLKLQNLINKNKGFRLVKELEFARLKGETIIPTKSMFDNNPDFFNTVSSVSEVISERQVNLPFDLFLGGNNPYPSNPSSLSTSSVTSSSFTASWSPVSGATSYDIVIDNQAPINLSTTSYSVTGLASNSSHSWKVRANKNSLNGSYSSVQNLNTLSADLLGIVSTLAGSGTAGLNDGVGTNASFYNPHGIAVDSNNNVYVVDRNNHRIRKITPDGVVSTFAGSTYGYTDATGTNARFNTPHGITIDSSNNLYVADSGNNRVRKITPDGIVSTVAGNSGEFYYPYGLAIDNLGYIYVVDNGNHRIRKITPTGVVSTIAGGIQGYADGVGDNAKFNNPAGIAIDNLGNLYVADLYNERIRKIIPDGTVSTIAGSIGGYADGTGSNAKFNHPYGVVIDASNNLYVVEYYNNKIRKITPAGVVSTFVGSTAGYADGTGTNAKFNNPIGIAIDNTGSLYVSDHNGQRIRKVQ